MTIVVGIATPEGLVLASDSRTTQQDQDNHHRIASDNAQKLFTVNGVGIATWGAAFLGTDTIAGVMDQFAASVEGQNLSLDELTAQIAGFFDKRTRQAIANIDGLDWSDEQGTGWFLGFMVAGYDEHGIGHVKSVHLPGPDIEGVDHTTNAPGVQWRGQTDVIQRLIKGVDWDRAGNEPQVASHLQAVEAHLRGLEYNTIHPITIQDGVDFADFLIRTTVDMQRFSDGTHNDPGELPGCGGPTQILAVERSGFTWVAPLNLTGPSRPGQAEGMALSRR
jgi:hypothetical protein